MRVRLVKKSLVIFLWCLLSVSLFGTTSSAEASLKAPAAAKVLRYSDIKLRISWKKVKGADGYVLYKYDENSKKYKKYRTINDKNTTHFIDKVGEHEAVKYKVSAYKKVNNKKQIGKKSYYVKARTYRQGEKKVNAGKVEVSIKGLFYQDAPGDFLAYYETLNLRAKVRASKYSKTKGKTPLNKKVRWYSSNPKIAKVSKNGKVTAQAQKGKCYIYSRAHNGKKSNKVWINVENYAKPKKNSIDIHEAWNDQSRYGMVVEIFENYYKTATDIAEYFYINRLTGQQAFRCWMQDGLVRMGPEIYVTDKVKQDLHNFVEKFPYMVEIYATSNYIKFTEFTGDDEERTTGVMVTFTFDKTKKDPTTYKQKYEIAENWIYGTL